MADQGRELTHERAPVLRTTMERYVGKVVHLPVILTSGEDSYLVAECSVIPGCITQGRTRDEALRNLREAIELRLENRADES